MPVPPIQYAYAGVNELPCQSGAGGVTDADIMQAETLFVCGVDGDSPLAVAIQQSAPTCKTQLGAATATTLQSAIDQNVPEILGALTAVIFPEGEALIMSDVVLEWVVKNLLPWIEQNVSVSIICDPGQPPGFSMQIVGQSPFARLTYNLFPTINCQGGSAVEVDTEIVQYNTCDVNAGPQNLTFPSVVAPDGTNSVALFQLIIDKLSNLEQCCPPCNLTTELLVTGAQGVNNLNFPLVGGVVGFDSLQFVITQETDQILAEFSNPPRWKYGTFTFKYEDGSYSQPQFVNYNGQRFFVKGATTPCIGVAYHLASGVIANIFGNAKLPWVGGIVYP